MNALWLDQIGMNFVNERSFSILRLKFPNSTRHITSRSDRDISISKFKLYVTL